MKKRIWELDAARGVCILGMVLVHLCYDLQAFMGGFALAQTPVFTFIQLWGGVLFFLISGICVTLGSKPVRRGLLVLGCGLAVSLVMHVGVRFGLLAPGMEIWFGVLHCLGTCMLLWPLARKLPVWGLGLLASALIALGIYFQGIRVESGWLFPLGLMRADFYSSDYFPLLPFFGFFLSGAVLGKLLYPNKTSLFPKVDDRQPVLRFLIGCGKWSLPIYLLHQPLITGFMMILLQMLNLGE